LKRPRRQKRAGGVELFITNVICGEIGLVARINGVVLCAESKFR
jgi:hypothetical protein